MSIPVAIKHIPVKERIDCFGDHSFLGRALTTGFRRCMPFASDNMHFGFMMAKRSIKKCLAP